MALMQRLDEEERSSIARILLFSPWLDFSAEDEIIANKRLHDDIITGDKLHRAVDVYTYASNFRNPLVSPLCALPEAFKGFPPIHIQMGGDEILTRQAVAFKQLAQEAGVDTMLDTWPGMMFMFQMAEEYLNDSHLAMEKIGKIVSGKSSINYEDDATRKEREDILRKNNIGQ